MSKKTTNSLAWLVGQGADLPALERQLVGAHDFHEKALVDEEQARLAFDLDPSTIETLTAARATVASGLEYISRAERMLEAERARVAAARREELGERRLVLLDQCADAFVDAEIAPFIDEEVKHLEAAAAARMKRIEFGNAIRSRSTELHTIERELGIDRQTGVHVDGQGMVRTSAPLPSPADRATRARATSEKLQTKAGAYPHHDLRSKYLRTVAEALNVRTLETNFDPTRSI